MRVNFCDLELGKDFFTMTLKALSVEETTDKLDFIKIKTSALRNAINRIKEATDWVKMFSNHVPEKVLASRIYKEHSKLT